MIFLAKVKVTPIAGMGHLISEPKFKIPPSPPPSLLISDKYLITRKCFAVMKKRRKVLRETNKQSNKEKGNKQTNTTKQLKKDSLVSSQTN